MDFKKYENRTIKIFISSTFQDMMSEREVLIKRVFTYMHNYCAKKNITLIEVDLRWGITSKESSEGKVIELCLSEVDKSRPFFMGIIGNRYGWRPSVEELKKRESIIANFPWVKKDIDDNLSITDMEIQYGVLRNKDLLQHSFFYLKDYDKNIIPTTPDEISLSNLRNTILNNPLSKATFYHSLDELEEIVTNDLIKLVDELYPSSEALDSTDIDMISKISYAKQKNSFFVENEKTTKFLKDYSFSSPLVISGNSGDGLSSIVANYIYQYNSLHKDAFIFFHFVNNAKDDNNLSKILRSFYNEAIKHFNINITIPENEDDLIENFPLLLSKIKEDFVIVIDDADNIILENQKSNLYWIPIFQKNAHVIFSTDDENYKQALIKKGFLNYEIPSFEKENAIKLINGYLGLYCKKLEPTYIDLLVEKKWTLKPLVLRCILNELRVFGLHEGLKDQICSYINCNSIDKLYENILIHYEIDYGYDITKDAFCYISISKNGLNENELIDILDSTRFKLSPLLNAISSLLELTSGLIYITNSHLQKTIENRYLKGNNRLKYQKLLIKYYEKNPYLMDNEIELAHLLYETKNIMKLKKYLSIPKVFNDLYKNNQYELSYYWKSIKEKYDVSNSYIAGYKFKLLDFDNDLFLLNITKFLKLTNDYKGAFYFAKKLLALRLANKNESSLIDAYSLLGTLYRENSKNSLALKYLNIAYKLQKKVYKKNHYLMVSTLNELADIYLDEGKYKKSLETNLLAYDIAKSVRGDNSILVAKVLHEIAWNYNYLSQYQKSIDYGLESISRYEKIYGENHPEIAFCYESMAWFYDDMGEYKKLFDAAMKANLICQKYFGESHSLTAAAYKQMALANYRIGDYSNALSYDLKSLNIYKNVYGNNHPKVSILLFQSGLALLKLKRYPEAKTFFKESIDIDAKTAEKGDLGISYNYYGKALMLSGDFDSALEVLNKAYQIICEEYGNDCNDASDSLFFLGRLYYLTKDYEKSKSYFQKAISLKEKIVDENSVDVAIIYNAYALTLKALNDLEATIYQEKAKKIYEYRDSMHLIDEID